MATRSKQLTTASPMPPLKTAAKTEKPRERLVCNGNHRRSANVSVSSIGQNLSRGAASDQRLCLDYLASWGFALRENRKR